MLDVAIMAPLMQISARSDPSSEPLSTQSATMVEKPISSRRPLSELPWVEIDEGETLSAH